LLPAAPQQGQHPRVPELLFAWISQGFARELIHFATGDSWAKYFALTELQSAALRAPKGAIIVNDIRARLDFASKNSEYKTVANTGGFKALLSALREASRPPEERPATILRAQAKHSVSR
jgi:hypothetical protein